MLAIGNREILNLPFVQEMVNLAKETIAAAYHPDIGITSSASDDCIFSNTNWARDLALISLVSGLFPEEIATTIAALVHHQDKSGILPIRIQRNDVFWSYVYRFFHLEKWMKNTDIKPWYEYSKRAVPARDTVYCLIIACFNLYRSGDKREFVKSMIPCLIKALETEEKHVDPKDQLVISRPCSNWGDCLKLKGKLVSINLPRYQALRIMAILVRENKGLSNQYSKQAQAVLSSCNQTFWDDSRGCFTVSAEDQRLDTLANILACLWLNDLDQCVRIQDALERETRDSLSGLLKCYSWPYTWREISLIRTGGMTGYGNTFFYPLLADLNILAQMRIASSHPSSLTQRNFIEKAQARFVSQTIIHSNLETFHEVLDDSYQPAQHPIFPRQFKSHPDFTPDAAVYYTTAIELSNFQAL